MPNIFTGAVGASWSEALNWSEGQVPGATSDVVLDGSSPDSIYDYTTARTYKSLDMTNYQGTLSLYWNNPGLGVSRYFFYGPTFFYLTNSLAFGAGATIFPAPNQFSAGWGDTPRSFWTFYVGATGATFSITSNGKDHGTAIFAEYPGMSLVLNDDLIISRTINIAGRPSTPIYLKSSVPGERRKIYIPTNNQGQETLSTSSSVVPDCGRGPYYVDYCNATDIFASGQTIISYGGTHSNCLNWKNIATTGEMPVENSSLFS